VGYKHVRIYPSSETSLLYPLAGRLSNTSQIDLSAPLPLPLPLPPPLLRPQSKESRDQNVQCLAQRFPLATQAQYSECVLGPGDLLFLPRHAWHCVSALEPSLGRRLWRRQRHIEEPGIEYKTKKEEAAEEEQQWEKMKREREDEEGEEEEGAEGEEENCHAPRHVMSVSFWWGERKAL
jgi:hypothetical protein